MCRFFDIEVSRGLFRMPGYIVNKLCF